MNKRYIVYAVLLGLAGFVVYKTSQGDKPVVTPPVTPGIAVILPDSPVVETPIPVVVTEPIVVERRSGTKLCQWYEDAGLRAVADMDGWSEATCTQNTCFLLVHETDVPAAWIMSAWLSEARSLDHDPRKENVELSIFTYRGDKETDHIAYFPDRDVFEAY